MIGKIIELSVKNKFLVILATLFVIAAGIYAIARTPLDAIPDLSDVQVIIFTEYPGQAPQVVEDQVTYPLTTAMLSVPFAKVVRGFPFSASPSFTSSSRTAPTFTGPAAVCWNT
jgi:Cu(I)/Ag(I) efflux system membrane protein CusA/SilA